MEWTDETLIELTAIAARDAMLDGKLAAIRYAEALARRVADRDGTIRAFVHFDETQVKRQAEAADARRGSGLPLGPLHGLPIGLKDIVDTGGIPTENGVTLDRGRVPEFDAWVVSRLRAAGAIIFGKTVTTELAGLAPGVTRNPRNTDHTPGGSSSGSAAAVADGMVPLAIGSQTGGSMIRPAAFCGVVGFKPSFGAIPRTGVLMQSHFLDTLGTFGRSVEDAALLADVLFGDDPGDPATRVGPHPLLLETAISAPPVEPRFAFVRQPVWKLAESETIESFGTCVAALGSLCSEIELPPVFATGIDARRWINFAEMVKWFRRYTDRSQDTLSDETRKALVEGAAVSAADYLDALDLRSELNRHLSGIFDRFDAILTPAAPGPAPAGLKSTGDSAFCALWTLCGTPAISLPLLSSSSGLPIGLQLVGRCGEDARLLRTARWLMARFEGVGQ